MQGFSRNGLWTAAICIALTVPHGFAGDPPSGFALESDGWTFRSPRDEIRPRFTLLPKGGYRGESFFRIEHDLREGLDGWLQKEWEVEGGSHYQLTVHRKLLHVKEPRRSALVRILWQDGDGKMVHADISEEQRGELGHVPTAEPEHPIDGSTDAEGWTEITGLFRAPSKARRAILELHLQWAPGGTADWSGVQFVESPPPSPRRVRLATIHYRPTGKSPKENCLEYQGLLKQAAIQKADLVVLGETVPSVGVKLKPHEIAETIPGPTTDLFGGWSKEHGLHIVLSLYEREGHLVYNTAVLLGPDGNLIGKYRKVALPHGEVENGVASGSEYPVFDTKLGKIGLMVCYDGFFPEVARALTNRGAEVIAWPVWGCNPLLAKARACENHVYIVSSTYMEPQQDWMLSAIFDPSGKVLVQAETWGSVVVREVDLSRPYIGPYNLGDFRAMIPRHRPPVEK